jgi:rod shape determining protein RodA
MTAVTSREPAVLTARDPRAPLDLTEPRAPMGARRRRSDWVLTGTATTLALIGALLVWAATRDAQRATGGDPNSFLYRHLLNVAIAGVLLLASSRLDARLLRLLGPVLYVGSLLGLIAVLGIGTSVNGARAWIRLGGGFEVQPAEFMKLGLVAGLAVLFAGRSAARRERGVHDPVPRWFDVLLALALLAVPLGLIMLQPDLGSAVVLVAAVLGVLVVSRVRARWIVGLLVVGVVAAVVVVKTGMLAEYQLQRLMSFTHPGRDTQGAAYDVNQAHIAIAHGGIFGTGLFRGPQTNGGFVPEQQTDFVFSVAGEEFGLVGGGVIIALFGLLCWRLLRIARAAEGIGRLLVVGIVCWFAFQTFENIGMTLGLTPVTGLPLPLVSYGGSAMFAEGLALGLAQAVWRSVDGPELP